MKSVRAYLANLAIRLLPPTRFFETKRWLLRWAGAELGRNVKICSSAQFCAGGTLAVGEGTWLGHRLLIVGGDADIRIGRDCDFAPNVTIATGTHVLLEGQDRAAGDGYSLPVTISDGCWIGTGATILGGSKIGKASMVAAGAVVRGAFPDRTLIGGVPARVIRHLDGSDRSMA